MAETEICYEAVAAAGSVPCDLKIKQEKIDPEIEQIINSKYSAETIDRKPHIGANGSVVTSDQESNDGDSRLSGGDSAVDADSNCNDDGEADEKKSIEPVKSSNEILAELFKVFNAAPPVELLNDDNLLKKSKHKKHKKEKKKKKKKSKELAKIKPERMEDGDGSDSSASSAKTKDDRSKSKQKKHKKDKHKDDKREKKVKDKKKEKFKDRDKETNKEKEREKERIKEKERENYKLRSSKDKLKDRDRFKEKEHKKSPIKKEPTLEHKSKSSKSYKRAVDERDQAEVPAKIFRKADDRRIKDHREVDRVQNSFYNGFRDDERNRRRSSSHSNNRNLSDVRIKKEPSDRTNNGTEFKPRIPSLREDGHISDISLSDEETYLNERSTRDEVRSRHDTNSSSNVSSRLESRYKSHNSFYTGSVRKHSRDRDRSDYHYRSRARSRSRSHDLGIDKKRLLEIARKNAISMFKRGNLPGCAEMSEEIKDKVLLKMRYGGRTVQDLTEFCKKLSNGENLNDISDLSSEEDSDVDKGGNAKAFHHPFVIKDRDPIVMHIRGKAPILPRKLQEDQTKAITLQFPVSSGQQHRMTEAWVPVVEPTNSLPKLPTLPAASQSTSIFKALLQKNVFQRTMPVETAQEPAFKAANAEAEVAGATPTTEATAVATTTIPTPVPPPIGVPPVTLVGVPPAGVSIGGVPSFVSPAVGVPPVGVPPVGGPPISFPAVANSEAVEPFVPDVPVPSTTKDVNVFPPAATTSLDVSSIISKRLNAMRRLQDNPMDSEALKMMYCSQKEMTCWASSKYTPGQFTGSTGANLLTARELNSGPQAWARRDQLTSTVPMTGGMGMHLLKKMGWKPGEGLGREKTGSLQPLLLDVKLDKRGLVSEQDNGYQQLPQTLKKRRNAVNIQEAQQNLQDKHPVSLLNELTSKRKWTPPLYSLENEGGPSHNKMFLFSVSINGQTFTPTQGANTKKDAKVKAARHCLQQMGIIP